jgi:vacuolar-type H+-ATPase subunit F/Vma7
MSRLVVLTTTDLAVGYRLAGAATVEVNTPAETEAELAGLLPHERGVIAVHAPYFYRLSRAMQRQIDSTDIPLVVPLPSGAAGAEVEDRRERLLQLLRQAVGYQITFDGNEGTTS